MTDRPIEEIKAADAFVESMVPSADNYITNAPLWHGWAIFDAFLAGMDYARSSGSNSTPEKP
jgi:hypothetical protein